MPFKKGHTLTTGRPLGSRNIKTHGVDFLLRYVAEEGADEFLSKLKLAGDEKFLLLFKDLLEYVKPKLARREVDVTSGGKPLYLPAEILKKNDLSDSGTA